jgi:glycosyltransferase involved in cell wall biosynthesis
VVDNYSTDNTKSIASKYTDKIFDKSPERSVQVNYGVTRALGKYIYRIDSDFVLDPEVINESVALAESMGYAAILIHNTSDSSVSFWARVRKFERDMYGEESLNVAARFIRKDVFLSVGGFDPSLNYGEDYDLHNRIIEKCRVGKIHAKEVHLGEYKSITEIIKVNYYYGKSARLFLRKNKLKGVKQISPIRKSFFKHYADFIKHPDLAVGFLVYQIVRYSAGLVGLIFCGKPPKAEYLLL